MVKNPITNERSLAGCYWTRDTVSNNVTYVPDLEALDRSAPEKICTHSLLHFTSVDDKFDDAEQGQYFEKSQQWMEHMGLLVKKRARGTGTTSNTEEVSVESVSLEETDNDDVGDNKVTSLYDLNVSAPVAELMFQLRDDPAEALAIFSMLDLLYDEFANKPGDLIGNQVAMFNIMLRIVGRRAHGADESHTAPALSVVSGQDEAWEKTSALLMELAKKTRDLPKDAQLPLLHIPTDEELAQEDQTLLLEKYKDQGNLDGYIWHILIENRIPTGLDTVTLYHLKQRLYHIGDRLRVMHNVLMLAPKYVKLEEIIRKCFRRTKWILIDSEV